MRLGSYNPFIVSPFFFLVWRGREREAADDGAAARAALLPREQACAGPRAEKGRPLPANMARHARFIK